MTIYEEDDSPEAAAEAPRQRSVSNAAPSDLVRELLESDDMAVFPFKHVPLSKRIISPSASAHRGGPSMSHSLDHPPSAASTSESVLPQPAQRPRKKDPKLRRSLVLSSPPGLFAGLGKLSSNGTSTEESAIVSLCASIQRATPEVICSDILRGSLDLLYESSDDISSALTSIFHDPSKYRRYGGFMDKSSVNNLSLIATQINDFIARHNVFRAIVSVQARWRAHRIRAIPRPMLSSMAQRNRCAFEILNLETNHQNILRRFLDAFSARSTTKNALPAEATQILGQDFPNFVSIHAVLVSRLSALLNVSSFGGFFIAGIGKLYLAQIRTLFRAYYPEFARNCAHSENIIRSLSTDKRSLTFLHTVEKECGASVLELITEITRHVPRLTLKLQAYGSWQTLSTADYAEAVEATSVMLDVSSSIEKALSDSVPLSAWFQIRRCLKIPESSVTLAHRHYLDRRRLFKHESILPKLSISNPSPLTLVLSNGLAGKSFVQKNVRCILFDDAIFFCSLDNKSKDSLKLNAVIDLDQSAVIKPMKENVSKSKTTAVSVFADSSASTELYLALRKPNQFLLLPSDDASNLDPNPSLARQIVKVTANSIEDAQHWVSLIETAIQSRMSTRLFGLPLRTLLDRESSQVPRFITFTTGWLLKHGTSVNGIFRVNPNSIIVQNIQSELETRTNYDFLSSYNPHDVGGVFKKYLCALPTPVIPYNLYLPLIDLCRRFLEVSPAFAVQLGEMLRSPSFQIPSENYYLLRYLTGFLQEFATHSAQTQMTDQNLAIVFAPSLMYSFELSPNGGDHLSHAHFTNDIILTMIRWHSLCFSSANI